MDRWGRYGRFKPWIILAALLLLGVQPAFAQSSPPTLETYWGIIEQIRNELVADEENETDVRRQAVIQLVGFQEIEMPDGTLQPIDHSYIINKIRSDELSNEHLSTLLTVYLTSRKAWPDPTFAQLDEAALNDILSQPQFQYVIEEPNFLQRLWQDMRQAVEDFFLRLFPEGSGIQIPLGNIIVGVAAVLVAVALAFALRGLLATVAGDAVLAADDVLGGEMLTADLALQRAQDLSTEGDFRTAVRYLYLSSLLLLEERGLLRYDRSLTNREYLRTVAHRPELADILREVIDVFDRVWYGFQTLQPNEYEAYARRVETLKQQKEAS